MTPDPLLDPKVRAHAAGTRIILWIEALLTAFWPVLSLTGIFLTLALFGVLQALPYVLHGLVLLGFAAMFALLARRGFHGLRIPSRDAVVRRLERDSGLQHRPFATLADRPTVDSGGIGNRLWDVHKERVRARIHRLGYSWPRTGLSDRDPRALRIAVLIAVVLGFAVAGSRSGQMIVAALSPMPSASTPQVPVDAWIKPPAYTGLAPILLKLDADKPAQIPTGSTIEARVSGSSKTPRLTLGKEKADFESVAGGGYSLSHPLTHSGTLSIKRGWSTLAHWNIQIIPDEAPKIAFVDPPEPTPSGTLRVDYQGTDDYGVASVSLQARLVDTSRPILADPIAVDLTAGQNAKLLRGTSFQDLTAHQWAGMVVAAKLVATDTAGQTAETTEIQLKLPERNFKNQTARQLASIRRHVILNDEIWSNLAGQVTGVASRPDLYYHDSAVFLALRVAGTELARYRREQSNQRVLEIENLLWYSALRIEEGDRPEADQAVRDAAKALEDALRDPNTPASEIERLTQELQAAIKRDLDAITENMRRNQQNQKNQQPPDPNTQTIDRQDLENMVEQMKQMAQNGSRQAAADMLAQLKQLMENLQAGQTPGDQNGESQKALDDLKDLAEKQRQLMNQQQGSNEGQQSSDQQDQNSDRDSQNQQNSGDPRRSQNQQNSNNQQNTGGQRNQSNKGDPAGGAGAQRQEQLRQSLGDTTRDIDKATGSIPQSLGEADRAMRDATRALQRGDGKEAAQSQQQAADQLDQAIQSLSDQLSQQSMQANGKRDGKSGADPFGRAGMDWGSVKVPTERDIQRSRDILEELRRRAGEHDRPRYELDYIERLLREF